jgi:hypothetical protein
MPFPRLQHDELIRMFITAKYFLERYLQNRINQERNPRVTNELTQIIDSFQSLLIAYESEMGVPGVIFNLMQEIYQIIINIPL